MRIILDTSGDLWGQLKAAQYALAEGGSAGHIVVLQVGPWLYAVKWNKKSIRVYPQ